MDYAIAVWQIGILALIAGVMIGVLAYRYFGPSKKEAEQLKTELDAVHEEMAGYKASVNQHFDKTSELVNDLTQNYVKVYQHLAEGAQTLGDSKSFDNLLEQHKGRVKIAVDVGTNAANVIADDSIVEPPADAVETAESAVDAVETAEPAVDAVETAEPAVDAEVGAAENEPVKEVEASSVPADIDQDEASATRH